MCVCVCVCVCVCMCTCLSVSFVSTHEHASICYNKPKVAFVPVLIVNCEQVVSGV